jgi:hypothetical protein
MAQLSPSFEIVKSAPAPSGTAGSVSLSNRLVLIHGLNLTWIGGKPQLPTLLAVVTEVAQQAQDFFCIFDANAVHVLREANRHRDVEAYDYLLRNYHQFFAVTTGGVKADDPIVALAAAHRGIIVSNDRYYDQIHHRWLRHFDRVLRVVRVRDCLYFNGRLLPLLGIYASMDRLEGSINSRFAKEAL